jgi:hypothetical protein
MENLHSVRKLEGYLSFDMIFPNGWSIPKKLVDENNLLESESPIPDMRMISFISQINEDNIEKTLKIVKSVVKYNKDRELKEKLFQERVKDLKTLFDKSSLDDLNRLEFNMKNKINKIETLLDGEPREMDEVVGDRDN